MKTKWTEIIIIVAALSLIPIVLDTFAAWDNDLPSDTQSWNIAAGKIRDNWDALEVELGVNIAEAHPYYQSAAPSTKPDGSTALDVDDNGRLWVDSDDDTVYVLSDYSGPTWTNTSAATGVTSADATFTLQNTDEEDSDGGRQSRFISKGEQSGGEPTTLGYIEFNHDGTSDDHKGQFIIKLNDGDDTDAPSKQPIGYLSTGKIDVSASLSVLDEDDLSSDDDEVVPTQQSVKAFVEGRTTFIIVSFTRNMTTASGTQTVTGVGFQPRMVSLTSSVASDDVACWGWDDGTTIRCNYQQSGGAYQTSSASSIVLQTGGTPDKQSAKITTLNSDGFVITWTKAGTPTGTATIVAMCYD